jgi:hypothetical protein
MNPSLTSALSDFTKKSEFSNSGLAAELSNEPPIHPSELNSITRTRLWLGKVVPFAFARFLMIFLSVLLPPCLGSPTAARPERRSLGGPPTLVGWHRRRRPLALLPINS